MRSIADSQGIMHMLLTSVTFRHPSEAKLKKLQKSIGNQMYSKKYSSHMRCWLLSLIEYYSLRSRFLSMGVPPSLVFLRAQIFRIYYV